MSLNKEHQRRDKQAFRLYAATKPANATPSRTHTNATSKEPYRGESYSGNSLGAARAGRVVVAV